MVSNRHWTCQLCHWTSQSLAVRNKVLFCITYSLATILLQQQLPNDVLKILTHSLVLPALLIYPFCGAYHLKHTVSSA